jgi:hypothetical protein
VLAEKEKQVKATIEKKEKQVKATIEKKEKQVKATIEKSNSLQILYRKTGEKNGWGCGGGCGGSGCRGPYASLVVALLAPPGSAALGRLGRRPSGSLAMVGVLRAC